MQTGGRPRSARHGVAFDVHDRNVLFYSEPQATGRFEDEQVKVLAAELAVHAESAETKARQSPFTRVLRDVGARYALLAVYDGKAFVQSVFNAAIEEICDAFETDYELAGRLKPIALQGLARLADTPARIYHEQSRALHQAVQAAQLHPQQRDECLAVCHAMRKLCNQTLLLADTLKRKPDLDNQEIEKTWTTLQDLRAQGEACRSMIAEQKKINDPYQ